MAAAVAAASSRSNRAGPLGLASGCQKLILRRFLILPAGRGPEFNPPNRSPCSGANAHARPLANTMDAPQQLTQTHFRPPPLHPPLHATDE